VAFLDGRDLELLDQGQRPIESFDGCAQFHEGMNVLGVGQLALELAHLLDLLLSAQ